MADPYEVLRTKLRETVKDMRQQELADLMGIKQSHVSEILSGRKIMGVKTLGAVRRLFPQLSPYVMAVLDSPRPRKRRQVAA